MGLLTIWDVTPYDFAMQMMQKPFGLPSSASPTAQNIPNFHYTSFTRTTSAWPIGWLSIYYSQPGDPEYLGCNPYGYVSQHIPASQWRQICSCLNTRQSKDDGVPFPRVPFWWGDVPHQRAGKGSVPVNRGSQKKNPPAFLRANDYLNCRELSDKAYISPKH